MTKEFAENDFKIGEALAGTVGTPYGEGMAEIAAMAQKRGTPSGDTLTGHPCVSVPDSCVSVPDSGYTSTSSNIERVSIKTWEGSVALPKKFSSQSI